MTIKFQQPTYCKIIIVLMLLFIEVSGLWAIDIGASAIIMGGETQGLFGVRSGNNQYHLGLMLAFLPFFISLMWLVSYILKKK